METKICCICGKEYTGYGNDAHPVKDGRCCDHCNWDVVLKERIRLSNINNKTQNG